ncbi:MAG: GAF domain-containing protein [Nitrospina sp.]|nr:GAF domain-containing protein [Nitrospina sp.]MBT6718166.1 GAF domain-containing protein [Nitrospina sp.]
MKNYSTKYVFIGVIACVGIFILDALLPLGIADGMLYVALVLLGLMAQNRKLIIIAFVLGSVLNLLGYFLSPPGGDLTHVVANRVLAFLTICLTTILCLLKNKADEKLQTAREFLETRVADRTAKLQEVNQRLNNEADSAQLVKVIAMASNEARAIDDTLYFCIERVCKFAGWPLGHLYVATDDPALGLIPTEIWHVGDPGKFDVFQKITGDTPMEMGIGLPGRVLASGKPEWIIDVTKDPNFPRANLAENIGVKAGFAFPILIGQEVVGVMEFYSSKAAEPDKEILAIMGQIGTQLGRVLERKRALDQSEISREQLRNLYHRLQEVREEERTRTAREVHDHLSQLLTTMKLELSLLDKKLLQHNPGIQESTKQLLEMSDDAIQSVQRIAMDLRPPILDDLGLPEAIEWQVKEFKGRTGIHCHFLDQINGFEMDLERATTLFRIFQETLTNIARHSKATKVSVKLYTCKDNINLQVEDNGCGITAEQIQSLRSLGLLGMRERAMVWGGNVKIDGVSEGGTKVTINIKKDGNGEN